MGCSASTPKSIPVIPNDKSEPVDEEDKDKSLSYEEDAGNEDPDDFQTIIFEYVFDYPIGKGSSGTVFKIHHSETNEIFAAKVFSKLYLTKRVLGESETSMDKVTREIGIMSKIDHPNCMSLIEIIQDSVTESLIVIMPFAELGPLSSDSWKANQMKETDAKRVFHQIAKGLEYLHSLNIIHRDIKPDNIMVFADGHVAIADYSVSMVLETEYTLLDDSEGTPAFNSPEECGGVPYRGKPADVWSFGMTLYVMIFGKLPFFNEDEEGMFFTQYYLISQKIRECEIDLDCFPLSPSLRDLFEKLIDKNPESRITISDVVQHRWFIED